MMPYSRRDPWPYPNEGPDDDGHHLDDEDERVALSDRELSWLTVAWAVPLGLALVVTGRICRAFVRVGGWYVRRLGERTQGGP